MTEEAPFDEASAPDNTDGPSLLKRMLDSPGMQGRTAELRALRAKRMAELGPLDGRMRAAHAGMLKRLYETRPSGESQILPTVITEEWSEMCRTPLSTGELFYRADQARLGVLTSAPVRLMELMRNRNADDPDSRPADIGRSAMRLLADVSLLVGSLDPDLTSSIPVDFETAVTVVAEARVGLRPVDEAQIQSWERNRETVVYGAGLAADMFATAFPKEFTGEA